MKLRTMTSITAMTMAILGTGLCPMGASDGVPRISPPNSLAFGKTLAEWKIDYMRWVLVGPYSIQGIMVDHVLLLPYMNQEWVSGTGTPDDPAVFTGELELRLRPGTPFVFNLPAYYRERYENDSIDLPMPDALMLEDVNLLVTIDGRTIISHANQGEFYTPETPFDPIVEYPAPTGYHSVAALYDQGFCFVSPPLPPGKHVISVHGSWIIPAGSFLGIPGGMGQEWDNTWTITVSPR
jgi:hypothetical protein